MKLMIVDDEEMIRELLKGMFEDDDFEVSCFSRGLDALENFSKLRPDVIILDLLMPDVDGFEVCKKIRELDRETRIIILSGVAGDDVRIMGQKLGANQVCFKPIALQALRSAVVG